jgi:hypothetical protein
VVDEPPLLQAATASAMSDADMSLEVGMGSSGR